MVVELGRGEEGEDSSLSYFVRGWGWAMFYVLWKDKKYKLVVHNNEMTKYGQVIDQSTIKECLFCSLNYYGTARRQYTLSRIRMMAVLYVIGQLQEANFSKRAEKQIGFFLSEQFGSDTCESALVKLSREGRIGGESLFWKLC